jgi:hypothetical protein
MNPNRQKNGAKKKKNPRRYLTTTAKKTSVLDAMSE